MVFDKDTLLEQLMQINVLAELLADNFFSFANDVNLFYPRSDLEFMIRSLFISWTWFVTIQLPLSTFKRNHMAVGRQISPHEQNCIQMTRLSHEKRLRNVDRF